MGHTIGSPSAPSPSVVTSDSAIWSLMQSERRPSPGLTEEQYLATSSRQLPGQEGQGMRVKVECGREKLGVEM